MHGPDVPQPGAARQQAGARRVVARAGGRARPSPASSFLNSPAGILFSPFALEARGAPQLSSETEGLGLAPRFPQGALLWLSGSASVPEPPPPSDSPVGWTPSQRRWAAPTPGAQPGGAGLSHTSPGPCPQQPPAHAPGLRRLPRGKGLASAPSFLCGSSPHSTPSALSCVRRDRALPAALGDWSWSKGWARGTLSLGSCSGASPTLGLSPGRAWGRLARTRGPPCLAPTSGRPGQRRPAQCVPCEARAPAGTPGPAKPVVSAGCGLARPPLPAGASVPGRRPRGQCPALFLAQEGWRGQPHLAWAHPRYLAPWASEEAQTPRPVTLPALRQAATRRSGVRAKLTSGTLGLGARAPETTPVSEAPSAQPL